MAAGASKRQRVKLPPKLEATARKVWGWNDFVDQIVGGVPHVQALVWAVLYRHARDGVVTLKRSAIAATIRMSDSTVGRATTALKKAGLLEVIRQGGLHVGASTYQLWVEDMRSAKQEASEAPTAEPEPVPEAAPEACLAGAGADL